MKQLSRRTVLAGSGTAIALGTAGWLGTVQPSEQSADSDEAAVPSGLEATFEYVYPGSDGVAMLRIGRLAGDGGETPMAYHPEVSEIGEAEWIVSATGSVGAEQRASIAHGEFEIDDDAERYSSDGSRGDFDLYTLEDDRSDEVIRLATDGETLLFGAEEWLRSTLDAHEGDETPYIEATDGVRSLLGVVDYSGQATLVEADDEIERPFERANVETDTLPERLVAHFTRTDESVSYTLAGWYAETPAEDDVETLRSYFSAQLSMEDVSSEVKEDDQIAVVRASRPYTPPEERPETLGYPQFHGYDEEAGDVLLQCRSGEQLPVERYEIEIEGEVYDGEWARGQEEIGEGSVIAIDADAIEPGDDLTINYEAPDGGYSSSSGTTVLRNLPFAVDFEPNERTAVLEYHEGPPLDADRITVNVHESHDEADGREPWSGTLESGDTATVSDLPLEGYVTIEYERPEGETVRIGGGRFGPPGRFEFEYDGRARTVTISYPDVEARREEHPGHPAERHSLEQDALQAENFEITVDGEPAGRQWSDVDDTIEPGASISIDDVPIDTEVAVAWVGEDGTRHEVADTHTVPDVEFEFSYDGEAEALTVTHAGGQSVDAAKLSVRLHAEAERTVEWDSDGTVSEGDEVVVEDVPEHGFAVVTYAERHLDHAPIPRLVEDA